MIETNTGDFLLRLEQKILRSIHKYAESGDQFLNLPDKEIFGEEGVKIRVNYLSRIVFSIENGKFYLLSSRKLLPKDKFVTIFSEENRGDTFPSVLDSKVVEKILLDRFSKNSFGLFTFDDFYKVIYKYNRIKTIPTNKVDEVMLGYDIRKYELSNTNDCFEKELKDFVFDVFFRSEGRVMINYFENTKNNLGTRVEKFLLDFVDDEEKLLFFFNNLNDPFGIEERKLLSSILNKNPNINMLKFYKGLLSNHKTISADKLILIANKLGDSFFELFENSNVNLKVEPYFDEVNFKNIDDKSFKSRFGELVRKKQIEIDKVSTLLSKMESYLEYLKSFQSNLLKGLNKTDIDKSKFKDMFSDFNQKEAYFFVGLETLDLFTDQLSKDERILLIKISKETSENLLGISEQLISINQK